MKPAITIKRRLCRSLAAIALFAVLFTLTACTIGPNGASWKTVSGSSESTFDGGFTFSAKSANGTLNRTFELTEEDLASIYVTSSCSKGGMFLTVSQDGNEDGTEIKQYITKHDNPLAADTLKPGDIRFSIRFEEASDCTVTIRWR